MIPSNKAKKWQRHFEGFLKKTTFFHRRTTYLFSNLSSIPSCPLSRDHRSCTLLPFPPFNKTGVHRAWLGHRQLGAFFCHFSHFIAVVFYVNLLDQQVCVVHRSTMQTNEDTSPTQVSDWALYKSLFESSPIPMSIWKWTNKGDPYAFSLIHVNKSAWTVRCTSPEKLLGQSLGDSDFLSHYVAEVFREVLHTQIPKSAGNFAYVENQPQSTFKVTVFPVLEDCVCAMFEDVTEMEIAERKLCVEREAKQKALQGKADMLARVAHGRWCTVMIWFTEMSLQNFVRL